MVTLSILVYFFVHIIFDLYTRGDKFRIAFAELGQLRSSFPDVPVLATTATATKSTYDSIVSRLLMEDVILVLFRSRWVWLILFYVTSKKP